MILSEDISHKAKILVIKEMINTSMYYRRRSNILTDSICLCLVYISDISMHIISTVPYT